MATLVSPGVAVSVIDESAYGSGSQGTVPLLVLATATNKSNVSGTGYASGTMASNAEKPYLLTSQRELVELFGAPRFQVVGGTPVHGSEVNEYGLMAAYSYLGLANRAYVLRADVDLAQLEPTNAEPVGAPDDGLYFLDLANTVWGVKEFNGSAWVSVPVSLPTIAEVDADMVPLSSFGTDGDYAISLYAGGLNPVNTLFKRDAGAWVVVSAFVGEHYKLGTTIPLAPPTGSIWIQTTSPASGANIVLKRYSASTAEWTSIPLVAYASEAAADAGIANKVAGMAFLEISSADPSYTFKVWTGSAWVEIIGTYSYESSLTTPVGNPVDGTLWYNADVVVDLYTKVAGGWQPVAGTVTVDATAPTSAVAGDFWIDSSDLENYPHIYEYNGSSWIARDNADQSTTNGVIFADLTETAGDDSDGGVATPIDAIPSLGLAGAPDHNFYPVGMLLWNSLVSTGNVKQYYAAADSWRSVSGNKEDGSPYMFRKAQRKMVVTAMQSTVNSNTKIREETTYFSLMAAPGYPELLDEMISLNVDRKETAFILVDTPLRLSPQGSSLVDWASGVNATVNGEDGLVTSSNMAAAFYPSGITSDLSGNDVVVPASHIALRTFAYNDQVSYPWFAPAGLTRGVVTNATNVGYIDAEGEFVAVALTNGQRDTLYANRINPIANFPGQGLYVFGQKTLQGFASALDRVNVSRLLAYLRERFDSIARPYIFEPNDKITRTNAKAAFDAFMSDMMGSKRAVYDFIVVCDETNNTPARIDRNELWIDVAIEPTKSGEFIYVPIRVVNTGDLGGTN
jgi:hypothetical protein